MNPERHASRARCWAGLCKPTVVCPILAMLWTGNAVAKESLTQLLAERMPDHGGIREVGADSQTVAPVWTGVELPGQL